jgi:5-methylcytosine-specific restriction endonuclease McrA
VTRKDDPKAVAARERAARYYRLNREAVLAKRAKWREGHRESARSLASRHYRLNRDAALERHAKWRETNREAISEYRKKYYYANKDAEVKRHAKWRMANPEKVARLNRVRLDRKANAPGSHTTQEWSAIVKRQGGRCATCHLKVKLERDHIVPLSRGGTDFASNLQGLCKPCNASKKAKTA